MPAPKNSGLSRCRRYIVAGLMLAVGLFGTCEVTFGQVPASPAAAPSPHPTATASAPPSVIGPPLGNNDPCTSLTAIVTRPTVSNSVCTVRPRHVLVETGYQNSSAQGGGNTVQYPQTLIRVGTTVPALEFDLQPPQYQRASIPAATLSGATDSAVGLKYVFGYTTKVAYGAQVFATVPTGAKAFSANGVQELYALNFGYTLSPAFSIAAVGAAQSLTNGSQHWTSFIPSVALSGTLPNNVTLFGELAEFTNALGQDTPTRAQYILGASYDFGTRVQGDLETGWSPTTSTGKYRYVGAGLSYYL